MRTDEELARELQEEYDEAARVDGSARELRRERERAIEADAAYARAMQEREALGAFGVRDARETGGALGSERSPVEVLDDLGRVFNALVGRRVGERGERDDGARANAVRSEETRRAVEFEIPIGPNGPSVRFGTNVFGSRGDPLVEAMEDLFATLERGRGRTVQMSSFMDMLNAMRDVIGGGVAGGAAGLSDEQREAVQTHAYERQPGETENATCSVCLSQLEDGEQAKTLECKHVYHPECIDRWLERSRLCPVCKRDVLTGEHEHS